jgi:hypothetical protein
LEFAAAAKSGRGERLSVEFLNWAAHKAVGRSQDGGFFSDLWSGYAAYGICPDEALPYKPTFDPALQPDAALLESAGKRRDPALAMHWIKRWNVRTGLTPLRLAAIKSTLRDGWPVCGGFRWPKQPVWNEGVLQMCPPAEVFDGHSVLIVGYRDDQRQPGGGAFLIRNSGAGGEGGADSGALSYEYVSAYMNDAAWIGPDAK